MLYWANTKKIIDKLCSRKVQFTDKDIVFLFRWDFGDADENFIKNSIEQLWNTKRFPKGWQKNGEHYIYIEPPIEKQKVDIYTVKISTGEFMGKNGFVNELSQAKFWARKSDASLAIKKNCLTTGVVVKCKVLEE